MDDKAFVWMWRYHALNMHPFDSIERAISFTAHVQDEGNGYLECIEYIDDEGHLGIMPSEEVETLIDKFYKTQSQRRLTNPGPPLVAKIEVQAPNGEKHHCEYIRGSVEDAKEDWKYFLTVFGPSRVSIEWKGGYGPNGNTTS